MDEICSFPLSLPPPPLLPFVTSLPDYPAQWGKIGWEKEEEEEEDTNPALLWRSLAQFFGQWMGIAQTTLREREGGREGGREEVL